MSGVYQIVCQKTGKRYIGSSKRPERRWNQHRYLLRKSTHVNNVLQDAWNACGESNFSFEILELCEDAIAKEREQWWIDSTDPALLFNLSSYSDMPPSQKGKKWNHTEAARRKMSEFQKGRKGRTLSLETRQKLSASLSGRSLSLEHRQNLSAAAIGKKMSDAARQKMSEKAKQRVGRTVSEETRKKIAESLHNRKRGNE